MAQIIDTLAEPLLTLAGEQVIVADTVTTATYAAAGVTNQSIYVVELWSPQGEQIADLSPYLRSRHFKVTRNRPEAIEMSFDLGQMEALVASLGTSVPAFFGPGYNEIRVRRGDRYLVGAQVSYLLPSIDGSRRSLDVRAVGFLELLKDRYIYPTDGTALGLTYTATDIGQVMWNFINLTQSRPNGSFGITQGTIQTSRLVGETWKPFGLNIRDLLIGITKWQNSVDFAFSADKVFSVSYPLGQDKTELRFALPGNIKSLRLPVDASQLATLVFARGSGNGSDQQLMQTWPASLSTTTPEQQVYKLREVINDYASFNTAQPLTDRAQEEYRKYATPTVIPEIVLDGNQEPFLGAYWLGDRVPISIDANQGSAFAALDGQMWRINEIDVTIDENDSETISLKVGLY
jgi:hypothetical protein